MAPDTFVRSACGRFDFLSSGAVAGRTRKRSGAGVSTEQKPTAVAPAGSRPLERHVVEATFVFHAGGSAKSPQSNRRHEATLLHRSLPARPKRKGQGAAARICRGCGWRSPRHFAIPAGTPEAKPSPAAALNFIVGTNASRLRPD